MKCTNVGHNVVSDNWNDYYSLKESWLGPWKLSYDWIIDLVITKLLTAFWAIDSTLVSDCKKKKSVVIIIS